VRRLLERPSLYQLFSWLVGAENSRSFYVERFVKPVDGERVLDIGCGPADILDHLPRVEYFGFDINPSYIDSAKRRYGERGRFHCQRVSEARIFTDEPDSFDIVLATGILHHLDDREAIELFEIAQRALRPGGRLVTFDGCYVEGQSGVARYLLGRDRGEFVRTREGYTRLAESVFGKVKASITHDLLRIPYTHIILECVK
jgi:SAM-dependent methyltransferase